MRMNIHVSLVCDAVSMGEWYLTSWRNVVPSSSRVKSSTKNAPWHLKMKALHFFKMVRSTYPVTQCHVSENPNAQIQCCVNLRSHKKSWLKGFRWYYITVGLSSVFDIVILDSLHYSFSNKGLQVEVGEKNLHLVSPLDHEASLRLLLFHIKWFSFWNMV